MKKLYFVLMAALMVFVTACSSGDNGNSGGTDGNSGGTGADTGNADASGTQPSGKQVELRYAIWDKNQEPAMQDIIKKFNETNPNIKVTVEVTPFEQYWTKLETSAAGKSLPDLFWMNPANFLKYASNGQLSPISDKIEADQIDMTNYPQSLIDLYTFDGNVYSFPKDLDTIGLWYNKVMFDEAGIPYPDDTWDWNKLLEAAQKLTDPAKGVYGFAAPNDQQQVMYNFIFQNEGHVISGDKKSLGYNEPESLEAMQFLNDLVLKYKVSPTLQQMTDNTTNVLFESGKVAMITAGSWNQIEFAQNEYTKDKVDVAPLPKGKKKATVINGLGNVIAANTKHPEEAWLFSKFLGSKEAADIQAESGAVIPAFNGTQGPFVSSNPSFNLQVFVDAMEYSVPYPISIETRKWQQFEIDYFKRAWAGEISVEEAAKLVTEEGNKVLAEEQ
ncbi:extracellular solute-binding protein [Paenibacillus sepulcri]|uniref:Extracellular solute-binding protein n=1 Tax=Paenibacillus sepulcri TaxID=359917 RepID=A0ABS7BW56_9BACL|nr:extracellular solute-binding protein [Paenibacillus sepulcri]